MIRRRPTALGVVCSLALIALPAVSAFADGGNSNQSDSSLTLTLSSFKSTPAASSGERYYHHRSKKSHPAPVTTSRQSSARGQLPSRGVVSSVTTPASLVGRLGVVVTDDASLLCTTPRYGRVQIHLTKGQDIAVSGETATDYAVVMVDHSLGYVSKANVQLLDYQVVNNTPAADTSAAPSGETAPTAFGPLSHSMVASALDYLNVPYVWGGNTRAGIDCSGFVKAVYAANGIDMPRTAREQAGVGYNVPHNVAAGDWRQWQPGDRMYFQCHHSYIDHTGMYIGDGKFIHASVGHNHQVAIDSVANSYYSAHLVAVRRSRELLSDANISSGSTESGSSDTGSDSESSQAQ